MAHGFPINNGKHFYQLDSLRGLAALAVMLHHWHIFWLLSPHSKYLAIAFQVLPFRLLIAGHSSVMMFFVLSGFVLSLPQIAGKQVVYSSYLIKRVCRIYLPYLVGLGVAILGCWKWHGLHAYGPWVDSAWSEAPKWKYVIQNILFLGPYNSGRYNVSFWTLVQEMRISLVFPFMCALVLRFRAQGGLLIAIALFAIDVCLKTFVPLPSGLADTFAYAGMFIFGILVAKNLPYLEERLSRLRQPAYWAILFVCICVYAYTPSLLNRMGLEDPSWDSVTAVGASGIILFSLANKKLGALLLRAPFLFLGKISYSMYLLHAPILFAFGYLFYNRLGPLIWLVPYAIVTIALSAVMYRTVEASSIQLGRNLTSTVAPTQSKSHAAM